MTRIKCKFYRYRCRNCMSINHGSICEHHRHWDFDGYDGCCENGDEEQSRGEDGRVTIPCKCKYVYRETVRFEKNYKQFEMDLDGLSIGKRWIPIERIEYLCIDNEELIGGDEKCQEKKQSASCDYSPR